jgi:hypothetical protein
MDPQQLPTNFATPNAASSSNRNLLFIGLIVVLGLGAVGFGILSIVAFGQANTARTTLEQQKKAAAEAARTEQKKLDEAAAEAANQSPFRSYIAPTEYGSFEIKFPKNWSSTSNEVRSGSTQVTLVVHPNFVHSSNGTDDLAAAKITLQQKTLAEYLKQYTNQKGVVQAETKVSEISGKQLTGKFTDKRVTRIVVIPIRDKTLVFTNENAAYAAEFDQILAQAKIIP